MKKIVLAAFLILSSLTISAQNSGIRAGVTFANPIGNTSDVYMLALGFELNYLIDVSDGILLGPSVAYNHYFGKELTENAESTSTGLVPVALATRLDLSEDFTVGADVGVGFGTDTSGSEFYYRPVVGYKLLDGYLSIEGFYSSIGSVKTLGLGFVGRL